MEYLKKKMIFCPDGVLMAENPKHVRVAQKKHVRMYANCVVLCWVLEFNLVAELCSIQGTELNGAMVSLSACGVLWWSQPGRR